MTRTLSYAGLLELTEAILMRGFGYSEEEARITAKVLVEADARGIPSHGVSRLEFYQRNLKGGFVTLGAIPEIVHQTPTSLLVDGCGGVGCYVAEWSIRKLIEKAKTSGAVFCAVRNSNHYGIAGLWAEEIAANDMIGLAFTNTYPCAIPTYCRQRLLGSNPVAVAIPEKDGRFFVLDMATTTVAHGKIELYDRRKEPMPIGWVVDENGRNTTDATAFEKHFLSDPLYGGHLFLGGEGELCGGHKGFGLGLLVELLCSGLSSGLSSFETYRDKGAGIAHFFGAIRLDIFGNADELKRHIGAILNTIRTSEKAEGEERIWIHGEKEAETRAHSMAQGVPIDEATWSFLETLAKDIKIPFPTAS
ncbi:malate dehydrogenase [Alphaproteobacteria bacterium]|nr:malate dehydrogenase [Alphaproteobacteria bacterium]